MEIKFLNGDVYVPKIVGGGVNPKMEGGNYPKDFRGGGISDPNNPPYTDLLSKLYF